MDTMHTHTSFDLEISIALSGLMSNKSVCLSLSCVWCVCMMFVWCVHVWYIWYVCVCVCVCVYVCRYSLNSIRKAPNNESPWNYLQG